MIAKVRQYWTLPVSERRLLWQMAIALPLVEMGLRLFGFNRTKQALTQWSQIGAPSPVNRNDEVIRYKRLFRRVCRVSPFTGRCLAQSLTLWALLQRRGIDTDLIFGQRYDQGRFDAHAWLEYQGRPINDSQQVHQRFVAFAKPIQLKK